jgi:NTP pyrophosphatase (non-canonical NTP hydrolase)
MTSHQFYSITEWQKETFKEATPLSKAKHLQKEAKELVESLECNDGGVDYEIADIVILAAGVARALGWSYEKFTKTIQEKFEVVKTRKWGEPDEDGVVLHIKE